MMLLLLFIFNMRRILPAKLIIVRLACPFFCTDKKYYDAESEYHHRHLNIKMQPLDLNAIYASDASLGAPCPTIIVSSAVRMQ
jgi:hypothetical protein